MSLKDLDKINQLAKQIEDIRGDGKDAKKVDADKLAKDLEDVINKYNDPDLPDSKK